MDIFVRNWMSIVGVHHQEFLNIIGNGSSATAEVRGILENYFRVRSLPLTHEPKKRAVTCIIAGYKAWMDAQTRFYSI